MLKKAAIVVAAIATGLLVGTPMAFADGAVPTANVTNNCTSSQSGGTITQTVTGGSGLINVAPVTGVIIPVTTQTQAANCTNVNVSDLFNINSNNTTRTVNRTTIRNSFNTFFGRGFPFN